MRTISEEEKKKLLFNCSNMKVLITQIYDLNGETYYTPKHSYAIMDKPPKFCKTVML